MASDGTINLRLDRRNMGVIARSGQSLGVRINTIIDRYSAMVDARRQGVLHNFNEAQLDELALALKAISGRRVAAEELKEAWGVGLSRQTAYLFFYLTHADTIVLAEALEGRSVALTPATADTKA